MNKLNVFPVPDGDTGTNMALTLGSVVRELDELPPDATMAKVAEAVRHGSLMGARGNSGVITSQILRGLAEGLAEVDGPVETPQVAAAFRRAVEVAFRAVKKPVEGTILTVLRDVSHAADQCEKHKLSVPDTLDTIVAEAFDSVARTPDLLPVLKENGVVDFRRLRVLHLPRGLLRRRHGARRLVACGRPGPRAGHGQGRHRAERRLGGLRLPLLHGVPVQCRAPPRRGRRSRVPRHHGRLRAAGGVSPRL